MSATPVYIICSPRPLVGKTLLARLLSEFLLLKNGSVCSFDINLKEPSLLEYLPRLTETAEVMDTFGKMQLMDRLIVHRRAGCRRRCKALSRERALTAEQCVSRRRPI